MSAGLTILRRRRRDSGRRVVTRWDVKDRLAWNEARKADPICAWHLRLAKILDVAL